MDQIDQMECTLYSVHIVHLALIRHFKSYRSQCTWGTDISPGGQIISNYGLDSMGQLCLWQCFVPLLVCVPVSVFSCIFEPFRCDRQGSEPERCRCVRDCTWCQSSSHLITCNAKENLQCEGEPAMHRRSSGRCSCMRDCCHETFCI